MGIVGLGRIGGILSQRARGFQMRVIAYDPYIADFRFEKLNVEKVPFEQLLRESDFSSPSIRPGPKRPRTW